MRIPNSRAIRSNWLAFAAFAFVGSRKSLRGNSACYKYTRVRWIGSVDELGRPFETVRAHRTAATDAKSSKNNRNATSRAASLSFPTSTNETDALHNKKKKKNWRKRETFRLVVQDASRWKWTRTFLDEPVAPGDWIGNTHQRWFSRSCRFICDENFRLIDF